MQHLQLPFSYTAYVPRRHLQDKETTLYLSPLSFLWPVLRLETQKPNNNKKQQQQNEAQDT